MAASRRRGAPRPGTHAATAARAPCVPRARAMPPDGRGLTRRPPACSAAVLHACGCGCNHKPVPAPRPALGRLSDVGGERRAGRTHRRPLGQRPARLPGGTNLCRTHTAVRCRSRSSYDTRPHHPRPGGPFVSPRLPPPRRAADPCCAPSCNPPQIGAAALPVGAAVRVRLLGALTLIDHGEFGRT
jgi:hypothetical protein